MSNVKIEAARAERDGRQHNGRSCKRCMYCSVAHSASQIEELCQTKHQNSSANAQREWGEASFTPRGRGVRSEFMTAILAASSLKQSLKPGTMRDDPTMSIDGIKGKKGIQECSSGTLTGSILPLDRHF